MANSVPEPIVQDARPAPPSQADARALRIVAKSIYKELRQSGLREEDVMAVAGELLGLVASDVKDRRASR